LDEALSVLSCITKSSFVAGCAEAYGISGVVVRAVILFFPKGISLQVDVSLISDSD